MLYILINKNILLRLFLKKFSFCFSVIRTSNTLGTLSTGPAEKIKSLWILAVTDRDHVCYLAWSGSSMC